jgi:GGDEF domain-containing protein
MDGTVDPDIAPRRELHLLLVSGGVGGRLGLRHVVEAVNADPEYEYTLTLAQTGSPAEAGAALAEGRVDAVLLDLGAGPQVTVRDLEPHLHRVPVIVLVEPGEHARARREIRRGAQDYLVTTRLSGDLLVRSLRYSLERLGVAFPGGSAAFLDELTGLYSRLGFLQIADHQVRLSRRKGRDFTLTFARLDGPSQGKVALRAAGEAMRSCFRGSDVLARIGGEDLVALAIETDDEDVALLRERLRARLAALGDGIHGLHIRVGALHVDHDATLGLEELLASGQRLLAEPVDDPGSQPSPPADP